MSPIFRTAITGTERRPLPPQTLEDLRNMGLGADDDPARTALEALAAEHLRQKAGFALSGLSDPQETVDAADGLPCPPAAADCLRKILAGLFAPALPEFLSILEQHRQSIPPEFLPGILDAHIQKKQAFEPLKKVLGSRGMRLAAQNPDWHGLYAAPNDDWETAPTNERVLLLQNKRVHGFV